MKHQAPIRTLLLSAGELALVQFPASSAWAQSPPVIASVSPAAASVGSTVTLTGSKLQNVTTPGDGEESSRSQFVTGSQIPGGMRSQFVTASKRNVRYLPFAFTEHGAIMAANVLSSPQAVTMSGRHYLSAPNFSARQIGKVEGWEEGRKISGRIIGEGPVSLTASPECWPQKGHGEEEVTRRTGFAGFPMASAAIQFPQAL